MNSVSRIFLSQLLVCAILLITAVGAAGQATYKQGETIFIETGVEAPDRNPTWYASMVAKPYAPLFEMLATQGGPSRYYPYTYPVTLKDLVRFHGHDCEGLTTAACAAWVAFKILFPDGIIDRSVLRGISGESPCMSDAVAYLTGARLQYGTLGFFKDKRYSHAIILYREDTKVAVLSTWKEGINNIPGEPVMLPGKITWQPKVSMKEVMALKEAVKKSGGKPTPYQLDLMRYQQWLNINDILEHPLEGSYQAKIIDNFTWGDWIDSAKTIGKPHERIDTRLKNHPYRSKPIAPAAEVGKS